MSRSNRWALSAIAVVAAGLLVACGSSSEIASTSLPPAPSSTAKIPMADEAAMMALCDRMVADRLSPEDATALAEGSGYAARVGSIDEQSQPLTMDLRPDRFTFDVVDGAVTACTIG